MSLVLDSSVALAWYFKDEQTEATRAVLEQVIMDGALVPALWRFEVANGFQMAVRRKRVDGAFRDRALANLAALSVEVDRESEVQAWSASVQLSTVHGLTVYDASYLELARRRRLKLATLDSALIKAATAEAVTVIGR